MDPSTSANHSSKHNHHHHPHHHCHHLHPHPTLITVEGKTQRISQISTISKPESQLSTISIPNSEGSVVQKEQYWMCAKRTKLEKLLMLAIFLLSIVVIGMTISIAVLASDDRKSELYKIVMLFAAPLAKLHGNPRFVDS